MVYLYNSNDYVCNSGKQIAVCTTLYTKERKENNSKSEIENALAVKQYTGDIYIKF